MGLLTEHENADICLFGDFNKRTSNIDDILFVNEDVLHNLNIDTDMLDQNNDQNSISIPKRVSCDTTVKNYGYWLIEFCKTFGIHILNGHYGIDKNVGHLTC